MYRPTSVKENSVSIYLHPYNFCSIHSCVDTRGIGPTELHDLHRVVGQETRSAAPPLRYEVLADRLVRPNTRKSQNKYFGQIDLQSAYPTLILIGI